MQIKISLNIWYLIFRDSCKIFIHRLLIERVINKIKLFFFNFKKIIKRRTRNLKKSFIKNIKLVRI